MMYTYQELFKKYNEFAEKVNYGQNPTELYEPINYMMQLGGKKLRPILSLMACNIFTSDIEKSMHAAHAIEVFHNFTLVHDDIMDNAPLRRGKETVFKKWNMPIAVLSGDLMMIKATQLLCETNYHDIKALLTIFNQTAVEVCEGQQIDMNFETQKTVSIEDYLNMIGLKTAVLLGCSLKIGALVGGATEYEASKLYEFGKNIGIAFQIQDDILDSFGDIAVTGKQVGGDIIANKKTLLLIELQECAMYDDKLLLENVLKITNDEEKIRNVLALYEKYQIKQYAEGKKQVYLENAFRELKETNISEEKFSVLIKTAQELMVRTS